MSDNYLTEDITDIPLHEVVPLLTALESFRSGDGIYSSGNPSDKATKMFKASWYDKGSKVAMNNQSGYVFLTNEDFQVAMIDNERLTLFLTCSECGNEGLEGEFEVMDSCEGCKDIMKDIKESNQ